jgi:hypothetical protein
MQKVIGWSLLTLLFGYAGIVGPIIDMGFSGLFVPATVVASSLIILLAIWPIRNHP